MNNNETTPRPWEVHETPILAKKLNHYAMIASGKHHVATVIDLPEAATNARLIAAAPAMLAALRAAQDEFDWLAKSIGENNGLPRGSYRFVNGTMHKVTAAIALATEGDNVAEKTEV